MTTLIQDIEKLSGQIKTINDNQMENSGMKSRTSKIIHKLGTDVHSMAKEMNPLHFLTHSSLKAGLQVLSPILCLYFNPHPVSG